MSFGRLFQAILNQRRHQWQRWQAVFVHRSEYRVAQMFLKFQDQPHHVDPKYIKPLADILFFLFQYANTGIFYSIFLTAQRVLYFSKKALNT